MSYKQFWPNPKNSADCLATDAEAIGDAVFLAVHLKMPVYLCSLGNNSQTIEEKNEEELLDALLIENPANRTLLIPIVGDSGVGKSHMVHWLETQLRYRHDDINRHIVRIPKSSSLRNALEKILEGLSGPVYDEIRIEMCTARLDSPPLTAAANLLAQLIISLDARHRAANEELRSHPANSDLRMIAAFTAPECIPAILMDPQLRGHFMRVEGQPKGVLCRIAERAIQGVRNGDGPENQFTENDLALEGIHLDDLAANTRRAVQALRRKRPNQKTDELEGLKLAVRLLNEVVDPALSSLLNFNGASLSDLFVRLRKQLLEDEKELVLLVEDFASLAGIQGSLLDAMIRQGDERGEQTLCTMRTALAVTKGYLNNRETALTRSNDAKGSEWLVEDHPFQGEEDALETYTDFIGNYLNAARLGVERLQKEFTTRSSNDNTLRSWVPNFFLEHKNDLDERDTLIIKSFGFSKNGEHPLFPFNKQSIRQLIRQKFRKQETYEFNPRRLIAIVLRETLIRQHPLFEVGEFPPEGWLNFEQKLLALPVLQEIRKRQSVAEGRLASLVYYWGDAPETPGEAAAMVPEIFSAFSAPSINWSEKAVEKKREAEPPEKKRPVITAQSPLIVSIGEWRSSRTLTQTDANIIRKELKDEIERWIDWDSLLIKPVELLHTNIHLPYGASGNPVRESQIMTRATANDAPLDTESELRFFAGLIAVIRYRENDCSWNYDGAEQHSADYRALIEPMVEQTVEWLRKKSHGLTQTDIKTLAKASLLGARILRIDGAATNSDVDNLSAIFAEAPSQAEITDGNDRWSTVRGQAQNQRQSILSKLKLVVSARQGSGKNIHAVDATILLSAISELRQSMLIPNGTDFDSFDESLKQHLRQLCDPLRVTAQNRAKELGDWHSKVTGFLGESFEIVAVIAQLRGAINLAHSTAVYSQTELQMDTLNAKISELQGLKIKETLTLAKSAADTTDLTVRLNKIAQIDRKVESSVLATLKHYDDFLDQTSKKIEAKLSGMPPSPATLGNRLADIVSRIKGSWNSLEGN
jgi:hypothetical protein